MTRIRPEWGLRRRSRRDHGRQRNGHAHDPFLRLAADDGGDARRGGGDDCQADGGDGDSIDGVHGQSPYGPGAESGAVVAGAARGSDRLNPMRGRCDAEM